LHYENLFDDVVEYGLRKPMFGTCAGAILMARDVTNPAQESMGLMDIEVERNAYGRQVDSRVVALDAEPEFEQRTFPGKLEAVFIRAPIIRRAGQGIHVLAEYAGDPVLIEQGQYLVASLFLEKL
jgi:5'-phosphate synthase pdxT subunit